MNYFFEPNSKNDVSSDEYPSHQQSADKSLYPPRGAHLVGANVTEMLAEPTLAKSLGATVQQIAHTIHAHPTMNEGVMEAAEVALGAAIHV